MRQLAIYGKGGIGKSMTSSHISFAFANAGKKVIHVGCDPKHDSTRLLLKGRMQVAILDVLRNNEFRVEDLKIEDVVCNSPLSESCSGMIYCAESGGPPAGTGCSGKGVTEAINTLRKLNVNDVLDLDVVLYDVLGDVVCGGFSTPLKQGLAQEVYIVTSGEIQALFAASNICKAIARFSARSGTRLGGLIGNLRNMENEQALLRDFADRVGTQVIGFIPYSEQIKAASGKGQTLFQYAPDSEACDAFRRLAENIENNTFMAVPKSMDFDELHNWWHKNKQSAPEQAAC
jgi:nitrogenase iron protein NifH